MSNKFDSNPKSFCLSRIFRKQETNKGQLISRNRQENEPRPYATAEKSLPTEKVCDRMLPRSTLLRNLARFPRILTSVFILIVHVLLYEEPIKLEIEMPLSQSFSRRPTADKELEKLWARDWFYGRSLRYWDRHGLQYDFRLQAPPAQ